MLFANGGGARLAMSLLVAESGSVGSGSASSACATESRDRNTLIAAAPDAGRKSGTNAGPCKALQWPNACASTNAPPFQAEQSANRRGERALPCFATTWVQLTSII